MEGNVGLPGGACPPLARVDVSIGIRTTPRMIAGAREENVPCELLVR